jgi:hypothetical protein
VALHVEGAAAGEEDELRARRRRDAEQAQRKKEVP